ncbi:MAG: hypothetical protein C5B49_08470 [Bdellovibrio sp.]|nr:MAG: hypothetical protein C5B49_08470 [Bdellovibrio sp.]
MPSFFRGHAVGFTLILPVVALALLATFAMSFLALLNSYQNTVANDTAKQDAQNAALALRFLYYDVTNCTSSVLSSPAQAEMKAFLAAPKDYSTSPSLAFYQPATTSFTAANYFLGPQTVYQSALINQVKISAAETLVIGKKTTSYLFWFALDYSDVAYKRKSLAPINIPMYVVADSVSGAFNSCSVTTMSSSSPYMTLEDFFCQTSLGKGYRYDARYGACFVGQFLSRL